MKNQMIDNFYEFVQSVDYSLMNNLIPDPSATEDGLDHDPREVFSGHYVPVAPTPLENAEYITHSKTFFYELGLDDQLIDDPLFKKVFTADLSEAFHPMKKYGWATGYALSIYGREYTAQCPFRTGNGYGDGRAISIFEGTFKGKRWEMQLKGSGRTPYCRGADGRAVLRSSVREFLAQELMHSLNIPTSRSLSLYTSKTQTVMRPWYSEDSKSYDPDIMLEHPIAISTRVAPSFLRVGQIELFARRVRAQNFSPQSVKELKMIVLHLIEREYKKEIDSSLSLDKKITKLALLFQERLTTLVANWIRVGYCQGNFNSDNCAAGGFTLDYGPFGFCEMFDPAFQPWTGGGRHFSFFNQPLAAELNFQKFCEAIGELIAFDSEEKDKLHLIAQNFSSLMQKKLQKAWSDKLGLKSFNQNLFEKLIFLMIEIQVDYTIFFRELSSIPSDISSLNKSFYQKLPDTLEKKWQQWLSEWRECVLSEHNGNSELAATSMKKVNPKYTWREWLIVPAYQKAQEGDYSLIYELQEVFANPYQEQSQEIENKYYRLRPKEYFAMGGVSHYSCSS